MTKLDDSYDSLVPNGQVCKEFGVCEMTLWRWDHDEGMIDLGWPLPVSIRNRNFRSRKQLEAFKQYLLSGEIKGHAARVAAAKPPRRRARKPQAVTAA